MLPPPLFAQFTAPEHLESIQIDSPLATIFFGNFIYSPRLGPAPTLYRSLAHFHHLGKFISSQVNCGSWNQYPRLTFYLLAKSAARIIICTHVHGQTSPSTLWVEKFDGDFENSRHLFSRRCRGLHHITFPATNLCSIFAKAKFFGQLALRPLLLLPQQLDFRTNLIDRTHLLLACCRFRLFCLKPSLMIHFCVVNTSFANFVSSIDKFVYENVS